MRSGYYLEHMRGRDETDGEDDESDYECVWKRGEPRIAVTITIRMTKAINKVREIRKP